MSEYDLLGELNRAAGTTGLGFSAACNALSGTTGLEGVGALNVLAGTTGKDLDGVLAYIVGRPGLGANAAARLVGVNLLTANQASIETDASGYGHLTNCAASKSSAKASSGASSLAMTATASDVAIAQTVSPYCPVVPGVSYTGYGEFVAATTARICQVYVQWMDSGSGFISNSMSTGYTDNTSAFGAATVTAKAPAGAAFASLVVVANSVVDGEVHYFDKGGIWAGYRTNWVAP